MSSAAVMIGALRVNFQTLLVPFAGIKLGDIGPKMGGNNIDNGFLILNNYRIPRTNMLMRNAVVRDCFLSLNAC